MAITLAVGFEIGAAASLASLVILKKMNKTLIWSLFITITLMQIQGNLYHSFINMGDFSNWSELFDLIEEDLLFQKRVLAFVSGGILPLIALGFIKSLVDYIKPEDEDDIITEGMLDDTLEDVDGFETKPSTEFFEDIDTDNSPEDMPFSEEEELKLWDGNLDGDFPNIEEIAEEYDDEHALDLALNNMVTDEDIKNIEVDIDIVNPSSVGAVVQKMPSPHLLVNDAEALNEALREKGQQDKEEFIKNKDNDN
jgi:hypothetical protein